MRDDTLQELLRSPLEDLPERRKGWGAFGSAFLVAAALGVEAESVRIVATRNNSAACYGSYQLDLNRTRLGAAWFNDTSPEGLQAVHDLLLHEFAHHGGIHHLDNRYYKACTHLGAKLTGLALEGLNNSG